MKASCSAPDLGVGFIGARREIELQLREHFEHFFDALFDADDSQFYLPASPIEPFDTFQDLGANLFEPQHRTGVSSTSVPRDDAPIQARSARGLGHTDQNLRTLASTCIAASAL